MDKIGSLQHWIQQHETRLTVLIVAVLFVGNLLFHPFTGYSVITNPLPHWIGIVGTALVVLSLGYSIKKRTRLIQAGKTKVWLDAHAYLGLIGPALIELHSGPSFDGVGGAARMMMWLVVLSGIAGKFLYNLIPRAMLEGVETSTALLDEKHILDHDIAALEQRRQQVAHQVQDVGLLAMLAGHRPARTNAGVFTNWNTFRDMLRFNYFYFKDLATSQREIQKQYRIEQTNLSQLYARLFQRISLERRLAWLMVTDEAIRLWRLMHIPPCILLVILTAAHGWTLLYY